MSVVITASGNHGPFKNPPEVLADRLRCDGTDLPFSVIGAYEISEDDNLAPNLANQPVSEEARKTLILKIDTDVDAIYAAAIGNRGPEYDVAASEATEYKLAGYPIAPVPPSVSSWATAKGWTNIQAADDILLAAAALNGARANIRAARLLRKEQARVATTVGALNIVEAQWTGFVKAVRSQLGV